MRILAFDTATTATAVALRDPEAGLEIELRDDPAPGERPGHATRLLPMVAALFERAGAESAGADSIGALGRADSQGGWDMVDLIAVGIGPGTFTGLRIGVATARALARAREIPLVGVSTLHALAAGAGEAGDGRVVLAVIDARRGEAFAAAWRHPQAGGSDPELDPSALRPEALALEVARLTAADGVGPLALGDGALRFREQLELAGAKIPPSDSQVHRISAINHCRLAAGLPATTPAEVEPAYLRAPDAEIAYRERHRGPK